MNYLNMKARTREGDWFEFSIADIPTMFNNNEFALFARPGTPLLSKETILRGDATTGLFEGDIVSLDGDRWLCCYERGFYLINANYEIRYLDSDSYEVIGNYFKDGFDIHLTLKKKHLFKIKGSVFRLEDIIGATNSKHIFIRGFKTPLDITKAKQECCITNNGRRLFFGDHIPEGVVSLHKGRISCKGSDGTYTDLAKRRE